MTSSEVWMQKCAAGDRLQEMSTEVLFKGLPRALNQIGVITGLKVESSPEFARAFAQEVSIFLYNHYGILTLDEIVLAFRLNASGEYGDIISHYGQNLTIEHIGRVLVQYKQRRAKLAVKIQNQEKLPEAPRPTSSAIDEEARQFANEYYRKYLTGEMTEITISYAHLVYNDLDRFGVLNLDKEKKIGYYKEALLFRKKELGLPAATKDERKAINKLVQSYLEKQVPVAEKELVRNYARRLALLDYFKALKGKDIKKIFEDERIHEGTPTNEAGRQETGKGEAKKNSTSQQEEAAN
ncbi:hypothetical protein KTO58_01180 [Chitinophaga pendula]|nr:hypothetical protein [Chitinophaga pendula]UCJ07818.1 hypothetical protein KTO58_01180 [Chitinophaga pendula]